MATEQITSTLPSRYDRSAAFAAIVAAYRAVAHPDRHNDAQALLRWEWLPKGPHPITDLYCDLMGHASYTTECDTIERTMRSDVAGILRDYEAKRRLRHEQARVEHEQARANEAAIRAAAAKPDHERSDAERELAQQMHWLATVASPEERKAANLKRVRDEQDRQTVMVLKFFAVLCVLTLVGFVVAGF